MFNYYLENLSGEKVFISRKDAIEIFKPYGFKVFVQMQKLPENNLSGNAWKRRSKNYKLVKFSCSCISSPCNHEHFYENPYFYVSIEN